MIKKYKIFFIIIFIFSFYSNSENNYKFITGYEKLLAKYKEMGIKFEFKKNENNIFSKNDTIPPPKYNIGDNRLFWVSNIDQGGQYIVNATCRAVSDYVYIFVDDNYWLTGNNGEVTPQIVNDYLIASSVSIPNDPTKGFLQYEQENYGKLPDVFDNDPRLYILLTDIKDGYVYQEENGQAGGYVAGFFDPINQMPDGYFGRRSNEVEMIYIDTWPTPKEFGLMTLTHELLHCLMTNIAEENNNHEELWLEEGLATFTSYDVGFAPDKIYKRYKNYAESYFEPLYYKSNNSLIEFNNDLEDYSQVYSFFVYLSEKYGKNTVYNIFKSKKQGIMSIEDVLRKQNINVDFKTIFFNYNIAMYADDIRFNNLWGYSSIDMGMRDTIRVNNQLRISNFLVSVANQSYPASVENMLIKNHAVQYYKFLNHSNANLPLIIESDVPISAAYIKINSLGIVDTIKVIGYNEYFLSTIIDNIKNTDEQIVLVISNGNDNDAVIKYRVGYPYGYPEYGKKSGKIEVFPNPAKNEIFINILETYFIDDWVNNRIKDADFKIFSLDGKLLKSVKIPPAERFNFRVNIEDLPSGLYIYYLVTANSVYNKGKFAVVK